MELSHNPRSRTFIEHFIKHVDTSPLKKTFLVWFGLYTDYNEIEYELDKIGFSSRQKKFIRNWALKNIHFFKEQK